VVGFAALASNTTGRNNVAVGTNALSGNTTGYDCVAIGRHALLNNIQGFSNIAIGANALPSVTNSSVNVAIGGNSLESNTGSYNTAIGYYSLQRNSSGNNNAVLGSLALFNCTTGSNNSALGYFADISDGNGTYRTALGSGSSCLTDNTIRCGRASTDTLRGYNYTADSDRRLKENIVDLDLGLNFIMTLRPVSYKWKDRTFITKNSDGTTKENRVTYHRNHCGFIAQEIGDALKATGKDYGIYQDSGVASGITEELPVDMNNYKDPADLKGYSVEQMLAVAVKAIQELKSKNDELEARIVALGSRK
jgi:hypothetical protein